MWPEIIQGQKEQALVLSNGTTIFRRYNSSPFDRRLLELTIQVTPKGLFNNYMKLNNRTEQAIVGFSVRATDIPYMEKSQENIIRDKIIEKIQFYKDMMTRIFNLFKAPFGFTDSFDLIIKNIAMEPENYFYAINYFGIERAKRLDIQSLEQTGLCKIQKLDWGGVIVQFPNDNNPFIKVPAEQRKKIMEIINRENQSSSPS
jgi:hypothetical protein